MVKKKKKRKEKFVRGFVYDELDQYSKEICKNINLNKNRTLIISHFITNTRSNQIFLQLYSPLQKIFKIMIRNSYKITLAILHARYFFIINKRQPFFKYMIYQCNMLLDEVQTGDSNCFFAILWQNFISFFFIVFRIKTVIGNSIILTISFMDHSNGFRIFLGAGGSANLFDSFSS